MSPALLHECTRVPVTAVASCGALLIAAEGPFLRFYRAKDSQFVSSVRVFKAQAVHGISVYAEDHNDVIKLVVWGGRLVRALEVNLTASCSGLTVALSNIGKASDWILDLSPRPTSLENESEYQEGTCAAVTAHNALLRVTIERRCADQHSDASSIRLSVSELTTSSRSILYSAHLFWESSCRLLVAAGTAFGEIMYWSWTQEHEDAEITRVHRVFLGHEGSIFGVQISQELPSGCCQQLKRVVASCSDDRTIRIWDVSDVITSINVAEDGDDGTETPRTRHTGFSNEAFDASSSGSSDCLAIGWGHSSRVWTIKFLETAPCSGSLLLQSAGEDATARTWELVLSARNDNASSYKLSQLEYAAHHSGKNLWATAIYENSTSLHHVVCGGADSKITAAPLPRIAQREQAKSGSTHAEYTLPDILAMTRATNGEAHPVALDGAYKSSKKVEFFRSYSFVDATTILLTTDSGKVLLGHLNSDDDFDPLRLLENSTYVTQMDDLCGYSVCTSGGLPGIAFVADAKGNIHVYRRETDSLEKIHSVTGKVGGMLAVSTSEITTRDTVALLVTAVGQNAAQLLYMDFDHTPKVVGDVMVPISELSTGSVITSMAHVGINGTNHVFLGFRRGSIAVYSVCDEGTEKGQATLVKIVNKVHADETVTSLKWISPFTNPRHGYLLSVGKDGRLAVHLIDLFDLSDVSFELVNSLALPIGPIIEGLYFYNDHVLVHGFSNKKWVLYDVTAEDDIMAVETGGAHRNWAYRPYSSTQGGTLIWTRAANLHICSQNQPSHAVLRPGGHGREIKAVAVSSRTSGESQRRLIATGAEDTDIKIFQYVDGELICQRTLRRHTAGIQHLQWSDDGSYLFSSGGCEEFYIWRIRDMPSFLGIGVVCEYVYTPESEHADLRIMSFDVKTTGSAHIISLVFSDSSIKVYRYDPMATVMWQPLVRGTYFTSCLTQCMFLSPLKLLTIGTDGHAVEWPLSPEAQQASTDSSKASTLSWQNPVKIHQNSSKDMVYHAISNAATLIVSSGDDGSLAFLLARTGTDESSSAQESTYATPPLLVSRAHGSAITACAIVARQSRIFLLTSGNDEWVRLWEITINETSNGVDSDETGSVSDGITIRRLNKIKTNVADVSSMAVLDVADEGGRVIICGVGMEVIKIDWDHK